jgi:anhydro-N-acetylmuramic acid kinase
MAELYIGLMSGTSLDGVDGVLVDLHAAHPNVITHAHEAFAGELRAELLALNSPTDNELQRAALAGNAIARRYARVVESLLQRSGVSAGDIRAVGAHGQTVRHRPQAFDDTGFTVQLNNPALLAELCRIDVVADFRSRDVAAGGQGAPLVPALHRAVFARSGEMVGVVNVGGFSNLTVLSDDQTLGFDCGPGNCLLDYWCERHTGLAFDADGQWAASGRVLDRLLEAMLATPYFALAPPKSTGRDLFNPCWLSPLLDAHAPGAATNDVQATLAELTAVCIARAVRSHASTASELLVCGGGAFNAHLLKRIKALLAPMRVDTTAARGLPPDQVEAVAFAWLARQFVLREPGNVAAVTGAAGLRVLGALYPAG